MTTDTNAVEKAKRRKLNMLELANELENVSKACKIIGYSRQQFYEIRRNFQTCGVEALLDRIPEANGPHPNRVCEEIEKEVLEYSLQRPTHGCLKVAQQLSLKGIKVSSGGVRGVLARNKLVTKHQRLLRLEEHRKDKIIPLSEDQIKLLERFDPEYREWYIQADSTGELVSMDIFMVGSLKRVGRVYLQTVIHCHSRFACGRLWWRRN